MNIIDARNLSFDYVRTDENNKVIDTTRALRDVSLTIAEGSFVCVLGHNGSGKSTFAKLLNALNLPTEGTLFIGEKDTKDESKLWDIRKETGMVFQNPDNQIIASVVEEDVGFGPENIGVPTKEIWERVNRALEAVDMTAYRLKSPNRLSGGQKQRVAIAGTMAMLPKCIVLDEPTAMLDPSGRREVVKTVTELNKQAHVTIVLITHYMEETVGADRIIVMDKGQVVMDGAPREVFSHVEELKAIHMDVPEVTELSFLLNKAGLPVPVSVLTRRELCDRLSELLPKQAEFEPDFVKQKPKHLEITDPVIRVSHLSHVYQQGTAMESYALRDVSFDIPRGSITAFIGHTGSGKSTLTQHLDGLLEATDGDILVNFRDNAPLFKEEPGRRQKKSKGRSEGAKRSKSNMASESASTAAILSSSNASAGAAADLPASATDRKTEAVSGINSAIDDSKFISIYHDNINKRQLRFKVGLVFQYPEYQLFEVDVITDVMYGPKNQGLSDDEARSRAKEALALVGMGEEYYEKSPFELSGGQKRRVAIAGVLAMRPEVLILDEPTAGLDPQGRDDLFREIKSLHEKAGMTIVLVSHSMDDVARYTDLVEVLDHGELRMSGTPEEIFRRYKELEEMGLGAPQMTYLIHELKDLGIRFEERPDTVEEMADAIVKLYRKYQDAKKDGRTKV